MPTLARFACSLIAHNHDAVKTPAMKSLRPLDRCRWLAALFAMTVTLSGCGMRGSERAQHDDAAIELGRLLFFDPSLSQDGKVSCASCHDPSRYFADARPVAMGTAGRRGTRNVPSLLDMPTTGPFFWDGREQDLRQVVLQPFTNEVEMGLADRLTLTRKLGSESRYRTAFAEAFGGEAVNESRISAALIAYLQSLQRHDSRYDEFVASAGNSVLNDEERAGLDVFKGNARCTDCHSLEPQPAALTDNLFHHTGIGFDKVAGNISGMLLKLDALQAQGHALGDAILTDQDIAELGKFAATRQPGDLGAFRTPSLRNVAFTAPYMHDGSIATLEEAVEREIYYRSLARGRPISLTVEEQRQLIAFLGTLSSR